MIYVIGNYVCHLPPEHELPKFQAQDKLYDKGHIPLIRKVLEKEKGWIVDIGANVGDSACLYASLGGNNILCVEGDPYLTSYLHRNMEQVENKVIVKEAFLFNEIISDKNLYYFFNGGSGEFITNQENAKSPENLNFIKMTDIEELTSSNVAIFKTDTDGLDIFITQDFLKSEMASNATINMEFSPNYDLIDNEGIREFLSKLQNSGYALALFDNRGAPHSFHECVEVDLIMDLLNYIQFSRSSSTMPFHYLDFWLFPSSKKTLFDEIANGYRQRKLM